MTSTPLREHWWVTWLICAASILIHAATHVAGDMDSWEGVAAFGYLPANQIRDGAYWSLLTTSVLHFEVWHVTFNVIWLWKIGSVMERYVGSAKYALFVLFAAFVSSSFQLSLSDDTGIGASGVGYAIFGYMWANRREHPEITRLITDNLVYLAIGWFFVCIALTYANILHVANGAHAGGLAFGGLLGLVKAKRDHRTFSSAAVVAVMLTAVVPLFWCPWSPSWLCDKAYANHERGQLEEALYWYTRVIEKMPDDPWAYQNRASVNYDLGRREEFKADAARAEELSGGS